MSEKPRVGDTILDAERMEPFVVIAHTANGVKAGSGRFRRTFRLRDMEVIDPDEGLWQEYRRTP